MKRWWMTPSFHTSVDTIPVETQSLLIEIGKSSSANNIFKIPSNDLAMIESEDNFSPKLYAVILPLIDFKQGFRATLYGNEGGYPAVNKHLGIRLESGDNNIVSNHIQNAIYIGVGTNPYDLLSESYDTVARTMGTFQTRKIKKIPPGLDSFGYCTWDAFYSKVNSENVVSGVQSLSSIGYPPRFVIIDDGWQSTTSKVDIKEQNPQTSGNTEMMNSKQQQPESSSTVETLHEAAESLTGTPISGDLATQQLKSTSDSPFIKFAAGIISKFYTNYVENGKPDSCPVRLWSFLSQTVLKATLIEFFAKNTDFSKRLSSWKVIFYY
jgi:raffinose synthase